MTIRRDLIPPPSAPPFWRRLTFAEVSSLSTITTTGGGVPFGDGGAGVTGIVTVSGTRMTLWDLTPLVTVVACPVYVEIVGTPSSTSSLNTVTVIAGCYNGVAGTGTAAGEIYRGGGSSTPIAFGQALSLVPSTGGIGGGTPTQSVPVAAGGVARGLVSVAQAGGRLNVPRASDAVAIVDSLETLAPLTEIVAGTALLSSDPNTFFIGARTNKPGGADWDATVSIYLPSAAFA